MIKAIQDVLAERQRQKEKKGFTESRDDNYLPGVLSQAGAAYAVSVSALPDAKRRAERLWPWQHVAKYLKPTPKDPRASLVKAAALILAEIERIDRAGGQPEEPQRLFFASDISGGFDTYKTAEEARAEAADRIPHYLDDGWDEEVTTVCWGEVFGQAIMVDKRPAPKGSDFNYVCDYVLSDDHGKPPASALKAFSQPMQPIELDAHGVMRFKDNAIVRKLLDHASPLGMSMNDIALLDVSDEDRMQFAQLIGYSVSGYGSLSYVSDESYEQAVMAQPEGE